MSLAAHFRLMARNNAWSNFVCSRPARGSRATTDGGTHELLSVASCHAEPHPAVDRYYIDALTKGGRGPSAFRDFVPFDDVASLRRAQEDSDRALIAFCDAERDDSLSRPS
jgi:hypothetical protein